MLESRYRLTGSNALPPQSPIYMPPALRGVVSGGTWDGPPSIAAQRLGLELRWNRYLTLIVGNRDGELEVSGGDDPDLVERIDEDHYSVLTQHHVVFPRGFNGLVLPVPRYYEPLPENAYCDSPAIVPILIEFDRDPLPLKIVCRMPRNRCEQIFYSGEAFCQIVPTPRGDVTVRSMTTEEKEAAVAKEKEANAAR